MRPLITVLVLAAITFVGCAVEPTPAPTSAPSGPVIALQLRRAPANLGCDAIRAPYDQATIRIDPTADEQVTAVADTGAILRTFWSNGFIAGTDRNPVVIGPDGTVVARDGDVLVVPEREWPRLGGYFVCASTDALYILDADPA